MFSERLLQPPDFVAIIGEAPSILPLEAGSDPGAFDHDDVRVSTRGSSDQLVITVSAPRTPLRRIQLRWRLDVPLEARVLGDSWERAYGELAWRGHEPDRCLPWYFLLYESRTGHTRAAGVRVQPSAICFWQVDPCGVSLWLDVASGGVGVELGGRTLEAATVIARDYDASVSPFAAARDFCRAMCPAPRLPAEPVVGSNDWYYAWGKNTPDQLLADADLVRELMPSGTVRPFTVIDDGWQTSAGCGGGPWHEGNANFPDMPGLAARLRERGVRPGIWMRPLGRNPALPETFRLPAREHPDPSLRCSLDPSRPEVLAAVAEGVRGVIDWGFELIKHDFTAFDTLGRWGSAMGHQVTGNGSFAHVLTQTGWSFADRSRTTAEITLGLYRAIREAAGDRALIMGCNTLSHLSAGIFELMRTGDDNSPLQWERTRRMGVNALAFRMPQHGAFYAADADIAPLGPDVPWELNRQWLDLLGRSGTPLFFSCPRHYVNGRTKDALRAAIARAVSTTAPAEPLDWMHNSSPQLWRDSTGETLRYDWFGAHGISIP